MSADTPRTDAVWKYVAGRITEQGYLLSCQLERELSALNASRASVPPRDPTETMIQAGLNSWRAKLGYPPAAIKLVWQAMHDSAPYPAGERVGVPVEPTDEMLAAANAALWKEFGRQFEPHEFDLHAAVSWKAMLAVVQPTAEPSAQPADAQAGDGMCDCTKDQQMRCHDMGRQFWPKGCRIAAGQPFAPPQPTNSKE